MDNYQIWSVDCWGNAKEGYEMNDRAKCGTLSLPAEYTDRDIMQALKSAGELNKYARLKSVVIEDNGDGLICIDDRSGYMLWQLEKIE